MYEAEAFEKLPRTCKPFALFQGLVVEKIHEEVCVSQLNNQGNVERPSRPGVSPHREWISYAEATELVGLGRTTLWKLAGAGEIEVARVGRAVRINRQSLTAYMKRSAQGGVVAAR